MANKINFITGETYTLSELFSGDRRIIIPDLQRDYCWGDVSNIKSTGETGELVSDFIANLIDQYEQNDRDVLNLGLFYGYEVPANHIQLCDGQQRLTTLFLLLGMLNKKSGKIRHYLISNYEYEHDDKEPYLNYAIRETSLYFLSDLVCNFFISNNDKVDEIKLKDWYFSEYNLDPSIQSIIIALKKIESILEDKDLDWIYSFEDWVLNKLTFLYFDMQNRKNGEETFVVINTTGEPLSATQNLKPLVINEKNDSFNNTVFLVEQQNGSLFTIDKCWEQIETWFWRKRHGDNDTADAGFAEFLRWVHIIEKYDILLPVNEQTKDIKYFIQNILQGKCNVEFPYKEISFQKIHRYWEALVWIYERCDDLNFPKEYLSPAINNDVNKRKAIGQNDCFVLLPVLKFVNDRVKDINNPTREEIHNCIRLYIFFTNLILINNVSKAVNTLVGEALKLVDCIDDTGDIVSILKCTSNISKQILSDEVLIKLKIQNDSNNREEVEQLFWNNESHPIWKGEIMPLIKWATKDGKFDIATFKLYADRFNLLFNGNCDDNIDMVRRALLTMQLDGYPTTFRGNTNYSFGWEYSDWKIVINENVDKFKTFIDAVQSNSLEGIINKYDDTTNIWFDFIKRPEILKYCRNKNIQKFNNSFRLIRKIKAKHFANLESYCLYIDFMKAIKKCVDNENLKRSDDIKYKDWCLWFYEENSAVVFDRTISGFKVAIDVYYGMTTTDSFDIQLFIREVNPEITKDTLRNYVEKFGLNWDNKMMRYVKSEIPKKSLLSSLNILLEELPIEFEK